MPAVGQVLDGVLDAAGEIADGGDEGAERADEGADHPALEERHAPADANSLELPFMALLARPSGQAWTPAIRLHLPYATGVAGSHAVTSGPDFNA